MRNHPFVDRKYPGPLWVRCAAAGGLAMALASGCATVQVEPFAEFQTAVVALHGSVDRAIGGAVAAEREALLDKLKAGELSLAQLSLVLAPDSYGWELFVPAGKDPGDVPPYYHWKQTRMELQLASLAVLGYADALAQLAKPEPMTEKEFNRLQVSLNALARSSLQHLSTGGARSRAGETESSGLISAAAADGFRVYLRHRRSADLRKAILANHASVVIYVGTLGALVEQLRANLQRHYLTTSQELLRGPAGGEGNGKKLLDLNDAAIARLEMLAAVQDVLAALPAAHAALAAAAADAEAGGALRTLAGCAERLDKLVDAEAATKPARK